MNEATNEIGLVPSVGQAMQQVRTNYTTALSIQKPRELKVVERLLCEEATLGAEDFYYGWGRGKNRVEGPSIVFALSIARLYGNCAIDNKDVQETASAWIFTATFVDLETGFTLSRAWEQPKNWTVYGDMDAHRKRTIRFQQGQSKAIRNVVLNCMPIGLIAAGMAAAKGKVAEKIINKVEKEGLDVVVTRALALLAQYDIDEDRVLAKFGWGSRQALDTDDLVLIACDCNAMKAERESPEVLYPYTDKTKTANGRVDGDDMFAPRTADDRRSVTPTKQQEHPKPLTTDDVNGIEQDIDTADSSSVLDTISHNLEGDLKTGAMHPETFEQLCARIQGKRNAFAEVAQANKTEAENQDGPLGGPDDPTDPSPLSPNVDRQPTDTAVQPGKPKPTLSPFQLLSRELSEQTSQSLREATLEDALQQKAAGIITGPEYEELSRMCRELRSGNGIDRDRETGDSEMFGQGTAGDPE